MKSIAAAIVTCCLLFGASWAVSGYFLQEAANAETEQETDPNPEDSSDLQSSEGSGEADPLPVSLLPDAAISIEAVLQMSDSIKKAEQQLVAREQRLTKKEQRSKLLFQELATEEDSIRAMSQSLDAKVEQLERLTLELNAKLDELDSKIAELQELRKQSGTDQQSKQTSIENKVNDVKNWFSNLPPEQASEYLKEFANNGKLEFAAALLQKMPDRQKSKILGAMSDAVLVEQLIDSLVPARTTSNE